MAIELFIYYRVRAADVEAANTAVRSMQSRLRGEFSSLRARLLRRPEVDENGTQTWMETYAIEGGLNDAMRARIGTLAEELVPQIESRHTEVFDACAW